MLEDMNSAILSNTIRCTWRIFVVQGLYTQENVKPSTRSPHRLIIDVGTNDTSTNKADFKLILEVTLSVKSDSY